MTKRATSKPAKPKHAVKAKAASKPAVKSASARSKPAQRAVAKIAAKVKTPAKPVALKPVAQKAVAQTTAKPKATTRAASGKGQDRKLTASAGTSTIVLPPDYRPSEDEPFMNEHHRLYFRQKLTAWKEEIIRQTKETLAGLHEDSTQHADLADRATSETDRALELRARDRQRKLINKIDAALARIEDGTYGYCEETGEPIGLKRLDARPIATLSLEAQERHERRERVYRED